MNVMEKYSIKRFVTKNNLRVSSRNLKKKSKIKKVSLSRIIFRLLTPFPQLHFYLYAKQVYFR